jgi:hypothetical protein
MWAIKQFTASKNASTAVAQTQATTQATTCAALQQALARAQAAGDTPTARMLASQLKQCGDGPGPGAKDLLTWFEDNAMWIGLGLGAIIVARPIAEGIFGGGRRR